MAKKVLMVCLGNICRSPLAEGIFRHLANSKDFVVASAGTANYHTGARPDGRSIEVARKNRIDISKQKARQLTTKDLDDFDYIFVMDEQNLINVLSLCTTEAQRQKIGLLTEVSGINAANVPDPYHGDEKDFEYVFDLVYTCCSAWLAKQ